MTTAERLIRETGIVSILRGFSASETRAVTETLDRAGVRAVEVTANTPEFVPILDGLSSTYAGAELSIGAGTVLDRETAVTAVRAGAEFLVTPTFDAGVVEVGNACGVPTVVGVATPTEALAAFEAGATMCKVFPATTLGPEFVSAVGGPLSQVPLVPTGGVNENNARAFFEAGAVALGIGSGLTPTQAVEAGDFEEISERATALLELAEEYTTTR